MKLVGLIGGTGWVSTAEYYRYINEEANRRRGELNFIDCILYSLDFGRVMALKNAGREPEVANLLMDAAKRVERSGAEGWALCTNTMHKFAGELLKEISIPLIHIADATGREIRRAGLGTVGLLGTRLTMELDFYKEKLRAMDIETVVPGPEDREIVERAIFDELLKEVFKPETKAEFLRIIEDLASRGAQGIILGCTEIPLLIHEDDTDLPIFNTTLIHSRAIVDFALGEVQDEHVEPR